MCSLKINVDSLRNQEKITFKEILSHDFLNIVEKDLLFNLPIYIEATAYLSSDYLIINFSAETSCQMPCNICNKSILTPIAIDKNYITINYEDVRHGIYDFSDDIKQAIMIKLPNYIECNNGSCEERKNVEKYIQNTSKKLDAIYFPFENI